MRPPKPLGGARRFLCADCAATAAKIVDGGDTDPVDLLGQSYRRRACSACATVVDVTTVVQNKYPLVRKKRTSRIPPTEPAVASSPEPEVA